MNKPILVTSQAEWDRLAPVLGTCYCPYLTEKGIKKAAKVYFLNEPFKGMYSWTFASMFKGETQTVDEYLALQEQNEPIVDGMVELNLPPQAQDWEVMYKQKANSYRNAVKEIQELKALYKAQTRAIGEALEEIEECKQMAWQGYKDSNKGYNLGEEYAFKRAKEILTQKLGDMPKKY